MNENPVLCKACNGLCCRNCPGIAAPAYFGLTPESRDYTELINVLNDPHWCIDWWEGDPRLVDFEDVVDGVTYPVGYFVRPSVVGAVGKLRDPTYGGVCCFWVDHRGCKLAADKRPTQCQQLLPKANTGKGSVVTTYSCKLATVYDKRALSVEWLPHWQFLHDFRRAT